MRDDRDDFVKQSKHDTAVQTLQCAREGGEVLVLIMTSVDQLAANKPDLNHLARPQLKRHHDHLLASFQVVEPIALLTMTFLEHQGQQHDGY